MRLCRSSFKALARSFLAVGLLSGVVALCWLTVALMLAQLTDAHLSGAPLAASLPQAIILAIAALGALAVSMARDTMLNRRRIWLAHGLGGAVLAHEVWRGSDIRHRTRSLAAVDAIAAFVGSAAARSLTLAPWATAAIAALWALHPDVAAVASMVLSLQVSLALLGGRMTRLARQFDTEAQARVMGQDAIASTRPDGVSLDHARLIAERWEMTQALRFGSSYRDLQRHSRRKALLATVDLSAAMALVLAAANGTSNGLSVGSLAALCIVTLGALHVMSRLVLEAPLIARARAARRQLITLRVAKTQHGEACPPAIAAPRMRAPITAGLLATAATVAAIVVTAVTWQLPAATAARDAIGWMRPPTAPQASTSEPAAAGRKHEANAAGEQAGAPAKSPEAAKAKTVPKGRS